VALLVNVTKVTSSLEITNSDAAFATLTVNTNKLGGARCHGASALSAPAVLANSVRVSANSSSSARLTGCKLAVSTIFILAMAALQRSRTARQSFQDNMGYRIKHGPNGKAAPHKWCERIRWCKRFRTRIAIRRKIEGSTARPRMAVFRSLHHVHVNVVDDTIGTGITLCTATSKQRHNLDEIRKVQECNKGEEKTWWLDAAEVVGRDIAKKCLDQNITQIVFDRGGFEYKGRVKALAEAARSAGLQF